MGAWEKVGIVQAPSVAPSSLCAGTHCAGPCENGAGQRQGSMPRVWVRRKSLGSTRHNWAQWHTTESWHTTVAGTASGTLHNFQCTVVLPRNVEMYGETGPTVQHLVEQSCAHWRSHGGAGGLARLGWASQVGLASLGPTHCKLSTPEASPQPIP